MYIVFIDAVYTDCVYAVYRATIEGTILSMVSSVYAVHSVYDVYSVYVVYALSSVYSVYSVYGVSVHTIFMS